MDEFPAPKSRATRGRGSAKRGRPGKKGADQSSRDETSSVVSSNKNADDSSSINDNMEIEDEDEEEMKLEDDDEDQILVENI